MNKDNIFFGVYIHHINKYIKPKIMSIDVANAGRYVFYLNFRTLGTGTNFCSAEQNFSFAELIDDASKYAVSVERFRVPLHTIEMFPATDPAVQFVPKAALPARTLSLTPIFSMNEFLVQMSKDGALVVSLDPSGRARIDFDYTDFSLLFNADVAAVLDVDRTLGLTLTGNQTIVGASTCFDRLDQLWKIQIEGLSGLSAVQQEIIDTNVFRNLLTDFIVPSSFSLSTTNVPGTAPNQNYTLSAPVRQDLEFNQAANRRFIMFRSNTPIQNVAIEITAIYRDGTRNRIRMPRRSVMEVKLAFWRKSA